MSNDDTEKLTDEAGSLGGNALLLAMRGEMQSLCELVRALDQKVEARLRDTTPMWEVVVARLDTIVAGQESHGRRLDAIEGRLDAIEGRLDAIEGRLDAIEGRLDAIAGRLDAIEGRLDAIEGKLGRLEVIEGEIRQLRGRNERMIGELSRDVVEVRAAQHDLEERLEKIENTPA